MSYYVSPLSPRSVPTSLVSSPGSSWASPGSSEHGFDFTCTTESGAGSAQMLDDFLDYTSMEQLRSTWQAKTQTPLVPRAEKVESGSTPRKVTQYQERVRTQRLEVRRILDAAENTLRSPVGFQSRLVGGSVLAALHAADELDGMPNLQRPNSTRGGEPFLAEKVARRRQQQRAHKQRQRSSDWQNYSKLLKLSQIACDLQTRFHTQDCDHNEKAALRKLMTLLTSGVDKEVLVAYERRLTKILRGPLSTFYLYL